ncbi:TEA-domain-containing protein, partial [Sphaerulina musiva SO2202]
MAVLLPAPVVPSNAPSHSDAIHGQSSRVLQEHSGNRQHDYFAASLEQEQKLPSACLSENAYVAYQHDPRPAHVSHQTRIQHNRSRDAQLGHRHGQRDPEQIRREAKYLLERFKASEAWSKYRDRQAKKPSSDHVWPEELEWAFFEALVTWPPMRRRQIQYKEKRRGRNELIADYIQEHTGERRDRKQVSSHIQVIKPFVRDDPHIMRYLSKDDLSNYGHSHMYYTHNHGQYSTGGRRAS